MKVRIFQRFSLKLLRCKARARKNQYANTQRTGCTTVRSIRVLCVPRRHQKMQRRACIASRMLSSSVVSPRQTLRELALKLNPAHQLVVPRMRLYSRVRVTMRRGLHFQCVWLTFTRSAIEHHPHRVWTCFGVCMLHA